jgi:hypothetical protein
VSFLDNHPEIGAVFTNAMIIGEQGAPIEDKTHFYYNIFSQPNRSRYEWLNFFFYQGNALCHPSILIRKICYENCGLYRSGLAQIPDFDMWIRLCLKYEIHVLPERLVRFRVRANERNASGNRPETRIRGQFEFLQVLENYRRIITSEEFLKVFPNANRYFRQEGFDIGFALGKIALEPSTSNITKFFGLQLLFEALNDPDRARKIYALYGFSPKDFIALTAEHDVFSIEIGAQVAEKDQQVQALTAQVADIINSKSWKIELFFRRIRLLIVPPNSRRARLLWLLIKVFPPFIKNRRNRELEEDLALIRSSDLFNEDWYLSRYPDIAQAKADPLLHYLRHGGFEGRDPSANFSSKGYFETHRDVRAAGINPLVHYLRHGKSEGRLPESQ